MGESIKKMFDKTDLVMMSCENNEQLLVAERYADRAESFLLSLFGSEMTAEEAVTYSEFKSNNKQKIAAKKVMLKK